MLAQLVQDLVHLERRQNGFDQHGGLDRALWDAKLVLRGDEDVVPQPRFEVRLDLRQVKIGAAAARDQFLRVVKHEQRKVE